MDANAKGRARGGKTKRRARDSTPPKARPRAKRSSAALIPALPTCGAKTRSRIGECRNPAGFKTDHVGQGRCNLHGGATPVKHGRYSTITRSRIRDLITKHEEDPNPLDTLPELAAARALFQDFIERYDETTAALVAWHRQRTLNPEDQEALYAAINELSEIHQSGRIELTDSQVETVEGARRAVAELGEELTRPKSVLDISDAYRIVSEITKIVERVEKARNTNTITYEQLKRFLFGFERVLEARIKDEGLLSQIKSDLLGVNL